MGMNLSLTVFGSMVVNALQQPHKGKKPMRSSSRARYMPGFLSGGRKRKVLLIY
jgi:hypothetical protein